MPTSSHRPRVLCMVDLSMAPEGLAALREVADVDCLEPNRCVLLEVIDGYDALWAHVDMEIESEVLERAVRLKIINTASTGTNHIDRDEAARRGIRILSITRDYGLLDQFTATAECAWMLILACHRHLRGAVGHVLEGGWGIKPFTGRQLSQQTLGVLGVGRLGKMTCAFGKAFRMNVLGCDLKGVDVPGVERVSFEDLLRRSDTISIHIHMDPENVHLFDDTTFALMKQGAVLANTSRGDIIDEGSPAAGTGIGEVGRLRCRCPARRVAGGHGRIARCPVRPDARQRGHHPSPRRRDRLLDPRGAHLFREESGALSGHR